MTIRDPNRSHGFGTGTLESGGGGAGGGGGGGNPGLLRAQSVRMRDDFGRTEIDTLARAFKRAHFSDVKGAFFNQRDSKWSYMTNFSYIFFSIFPVKN